MWKIYKLGGEYELDEISKIVLAILTSIGGIGAIIIASIKFSSNIIAKRLEEKYSLKMNKGLEKYKYGLDNKIYISKIKFDAEFLIYRELSKSFFEMVKDISTLIPVVGKRPVDEENKKIYEERVYRKALNKTVIAQDVLNSNAPFIREKLYIEYNEILKLCSEQLDVFERRWNVLILESQKEKEAFSGEDYKRTDTINRKFNELNNDIREYLSSLEILD